MAPARGQAQRYARGSSGGGGAGRARASPQRRGGCAASPAAGAGAAQHSRSIEETDGREGRSEAAGDGASTSFCNDPTRSAEAPPATTPGAGWGNGEGEGERGTVTHSLPTLPGHKRSLPVSQNAGFWQYKNHRHTFIEHKQFTFETVN